jgi:putative ABC transport system permease protein
MRLTRKDPMRSLTPHSSAALVALLALWPGPLSAQVVEVAVERQLAGELGVSVGDTVTLGSTADSLSFPGVIAAIYEPRPDPAEIAKRERHIRLHLPDLAHLLGAPDRVDRLSIGLRPGISAETAVDLLNAGAFGYRAYSSRELATESSQTFLVVSRFHRAIAVITIVASAVFLLCIMLLKVEERRLDAAVMRFVGVRRRTIFGALLLEAALVASFGSIVGTGLAYLASAITNVYYRDFFSTDLTFSLITPGTVLFSVALSLLLGVLAGAVAAWRLIHTPPLVLWGRG